MTLLMYVILVSIPEYDIVCHYSLILANVNRSLVMVRRSGRYLSGKGLTSNALWDAKQASHNALRRFYSPIVNSRPSLRPKTSGK